MDNICAQKKKLFNILDLILLLNLMRFRLGCIKARFDEILGFCCYAFCSFYYFITFSEQLYVYWNLILRLGGSPLDSDLDLVFLTIFLAGTILRVKNADLSV